MGVWFPPGKISAFLQIGTVAWDPVGVLFDPEAWVARVRGGEAEETLRVRSAGEPSPIPATPGMT